MFYPLLIKYTQKTADKTLEQRFLKNARPHAKTLKQQQVI